MPRTPCPTTPPHPYILNHKHNHMTYILPACMHRAAPVSVALADNQSFSTSMFGYSFCFRIVDIHEIIFLPTIREQRLLNEQAFHYLLNYSHVRFIIYRNGVATRRYCAWYCTLPLSSSVKHGRFQAIMSGALQVFDRC